MLDDEIETIKNNFEKQEFEETPNGINFYLFLYLTFIFQILSIKNIFTI